MKRYLNRLLITIFQIVSLSLLNVCVYSSEGEEPAAITEPVPTSDDLSKSKEDLIGDLSSKDDDVVVTAIDVLGERGQVEAVPALAGLVNSQNSKIRQNVAVALGEIGAVQGIEALGSLANDKNGDVQYKAIYSLGKIQDKGAVPVLLDLANSKNTRIANAAIRSLGDIGSNEAIPALIKIAKTISLEGKTTKRKEDAARQHRSQKTSSGKAVSWIKCRQEAVLSLGRIGGKEKEVVDLLKDLLKDESSCIRRNASYALCLLAPKDAVSEIVNAIKKKDSNIQINLKYALKIINTQEVVDKIKELYTSSNKDNAVRLVAIEILSSMRNDACGPFLIEAMGDKNKSIRFSAIKGLGELCSKDAFTGLCRILKEDKDDGIRACAAEALGEIRYPESSGPLLEALDDQDKKVREEALESLICIGDKKIIPILKKKIEDTSARIKTKASSKSSERTKMYKSSAKKQKTQYVGSEEGISSIADIARCIAIVGGKEESSYLLELMKHKDNTVREAVVQSIYYAGDESVISCLIDIVSNKEENLDLRLLAITSLGNIGTKKAIDCLVSNLSSDKDKIVIGCLNGLRWFKDKESVPNIIPLLKHKDKAVVVNAARTLSDIGAKEAFSQVNEVAWQEKGNNRLRYLGFAAKLLDENDKANYDKILKEYIIALNEEFSATSVVADLAIYAAIIAAAVLLGGGGGGAGNTGGPQYRYNWYPSYGGGYQIIYLSPPPSNTMVNDIIPPNKSIGIVSAIDERDRAEKAVLAASGLCELKDIQGRVLLERALRSPYDEVRAEVARALAEIKDSRSFIPLVYYVQDILALNRGYVAKALGSIVKKESFPYIRLVAFDDFADNRRLSISALEELKSQESAELVRELFNREKDAQLWMEEAGALYILTNEVSDKVKQKILEYLNSHIPSIRKTAVNMCGKMHIQEARQVLEKISQEDPVYIVRKSAQDALEKS